MEGLASIIIVTYNHRNYLTACIESVRAQAYPREIILVDNGSSDGTPDFIAETWPEIHLIRNTNTGFGAGNNLGARKATGEYLVFLNPDTIVEKDGLTNLIGPIAANPRTITTPKILLYDGSAINTCGNINHFTGLTFTRYLNEPPGSHNEPEEVSGISGACFAIRKEEFNRMGGFDERFFLYNEDSEFSWRAHLFGNPILYVPSSVIRHDYSLAVSPQKMYHLEKGRYLILKTYFSFGMVLARFPSLLIAEILTFGYAARFGLDGFSLKLKAMYEEVFLAGSCVHRDGHRVMEHLEVRIPVDQLVSGPVERLALKVGNWVFAGNHAVFQSIRGKE